MPFLKSVRYCPSPCDPVLGNIRNGVGGVDYEGQDWDGDYGEERRGKEVITTFIEPEDNLSNPTLRISD